MSKVILFAIISILFHSCTPAPSITDKTNCSPYTRHDTVYVNRGLPTSLSYSFYCAFVEGEQLSYCCTVRENLWKWIRSLPMDLQNDMIDQEVVVEKIYYLSDSSTQQKTILTYDAALEHHMYSYIGKHQGFPSVVFSTRIVSAKKNTREQKEGLLIRLNEHLNQ